MNRGLALSLLLLAFLFVLIGANAFMIGEAIAENEAVLASFEGEKDLSPEGAAAAILTFERHRFLFSVSIPLSYLQKYEEALYTLEAAALAGDEEGYAGAHAEARLALNQMKKSALFSPEQIF